MRHHFGHDAARDAALFELLDTVFPGLGAGAAGLAALGASWESISTPWVQFDEARAVAHVGVIPLPLVLEGRAVTVASVHAVATHPDRRRRGLMRGLLEEMFHDTAGRHATHVLTTDHPEYYLPFGFRVVPECAFPLAVPPAAGRAEFRPLDPGDPADLECAHRVIAGRTPVSDVVGVRGAGAAAAVFLFSEWRRSPLYSAELDALLCLERQGDRVEIFDVVAARVPTLDDILARLPGRVAEVVLHFAPDRVVPGGAATPVPRLFQQGGDSYLMARGPFVGENVPFTLPRTGRT